MNTQHIYYPNLSVDCVLLGFNGEELKVLLVESNNEKHVYNKFKLPGRLIYENEDLNQAAKNVLSELTGISNAYLRQFKTFGSPDRTANPEDILWLENAVNLKVGRIVTVAYMSLIRITGKLNDISPEFKAVWCSLKNIPQLAFDHNQIIHEAKEEVSRALRTEPSLLFELLPSKFTAAQMRKLYEEVLEKEIDVRNFHKKLTSIPYIMALEERESNVSHRAARYYRFDKKLYKKHFKQ